MCDKTAFAGKKLLVVQLLAKACLIVGQSNVQLLILDHMECADTARLDDIQTDLRMFPPEISEDPRQKTRTELQRHRHADMIAIMCHILDFLIKLIHLV